MTPECADPWAPLPDSAWDPPAARHLLRRAGWSARPEEVDRACAEGLPATLDRLFPGEVLLLDEPREVADYARQLPEFRQRAHGAPVEQRRSINREEEELAQQGLRRLAMSWLAYASMPRVSAFSKWLLFLGNIYVVGADKVRNPHLIWRHFDTLSRHAMGSAPLLAKAVSRSPAMILYLDLEQNRPGAPNENFARELFELFLLGEGHYTEKDIKESARAFTGYRYNPQLDASVFAPRQHDPGIKTIFGRSGAFTGDGVIDLAFEQRAAGARFAAKLADNYLCDGGLSPDLLLAFGDLWRTRGRYDLRWAAKTFFGSRLFFAERFRGALIKSPIQFYLGLVQDLGLDIAPSPRLILAPLRQMGQAPYFPPNVRGWVGGRQWITSASLSARRGVVEMLFTPLDESRLNADEQREFDRARQAGAGRFSVDGRRIEAWAAMEPATAVGHLESTLLPFPLEPSLKAALVSFLAASKPAPGEKLRRMRRAAVTLLESPAYQLC